MKASIRRQLRNDFAVTFLLKVLAAGMAFFVQIFVARTLGVADYGNLSFFLVTSTVVAQAVSFGIPKASYRFLPPLVAAKDLRAVSGYCTWAISTVVLVSSLVVCLVWFLLSSSGLAFDGVPGLIACVMFIASALQIVYADIFRALGHPIFSEFIAGIGRPLFTSVLLSVFVLWFGSPSVSLVSTFFVASVGFVTIIASVRLFLRWHVGLSLRPWVIEKQFSELEGGGWSRTAMAMLVVALCSLVLARADFLVMGLMSSAESVGVYSAAMKIVALSAMPLLAINVVLSPRLSVAYGRRDWSMVKKLLRVSVICSLAFALSFWIAFLLFSQEILSLFGEGYIVGAPWLATLAFSQVLNSFSGSSGYLLVVSGNASTLRKLSLFSCGIAIISSIVLVKLFDGIGAALANCITFGFQSAALITFASIRLTKVADAPPSDSEY